MTEVPSLLEALQDRTFTVSEYVEFVNALITPLEVEVTGEVTDFKETHDWVFFALKDKEQNAILSCGLHASGYRRMGLMLEDGMEVKVRGHSKVTPKSGRFGFWVDSIELVGEGALRRAYELLKSRLETEGLFVRKRALPACISHIGVISSRDGVVIHDLLKNLDRRGIRVDFMHSAVDGEKAASELVKAVEHFRHTSHPPEVLVVIRGGGSLESLQCFNNELLCRALFASPVPVVVGIGHDVDVTLAELIADARASTPTGVAHLINQSWDETLARIPEIMHTLERLFTYRMESIAARMKDFSQSVDRDFTRILTDITWKIKNFEQLLALVDPTRVLKRGYSIVYAPNGTIVRTTGSLKKGDGIMAQVFDGTVIATVDSILKK